MLLKNLLRQIFGPASLGGARGVSLRNFCPDLITRYAAPCSKLSVPKGKTNEEIVVEVEK
jgi:hypothetical protein